ncbi:MAG: hypothetical protein K2X28_08635 [Alphaproteobacteria bacterium]|nr:hypothetical protein [Alphaproteobacteria bacterium]
MTIFIVIPVLAKAGNTGIHNLLKFVDSRFRGNDIFYKCCYYAVVLRDTKKPDGFDVRIWLLNENEVLS